MKVLIVAGWYPSKYNLASGDFVMYQTRALVEAGIEAAVIFAYLNARMIFNPKDILHKYSYNIEAGVPTFRLSGLFFPKINSFFLDWWAERFETLFLKYHEKFGKPDLLHAQTFLGGFVAMRLSKKYNIPYLVTEHQTPILTDEIPKWKILFMKKVYDNAAITMAVSHALKNKMESSFTNRKVTVVPNFIDTSKFSIVKQKHSGFNFIAIGDLIPRKGFEVLIKAYALFVREGYEQTSLTILGDGADKKKLSGLAVSMKIDHQVRFPGRCSQEEVAVYLKQSDVFVMSSKVETFGIVIIEAMASGLPVISTECHGPLDIVTESTGIFVPVDDIVAMKNAMVFMFNNKNKYNRTKIRNHVVENFSNEVVTLQLEEMYKSVLTLNIDEKG